MKCRLCLRHTDRLVIRPCSHAAAKLAVGRWHYTHRLPGAIFVRYGVWEDGRFVGVVIFGCGANANSARPFGLDRRAVCELMRVALAPGRCVPTSRVVARCLDRLKAERPGLRLCISYADPAHGHVGVLYQAGNWTYLGPTKAEPEVYALGRRHHRRSLYQRYGTSSIEWLCRHVDPSARLVPSVPKHKYVYPFDAQLRRRLRRAARPFPSAVKESQATRSVPSREGHVRSVLTAPIPDEAMSIPQRRERCRRRANSG